MWAEYPDQQTIDEYGNKIASEIIRKWEIGATKYGTTFNGLPTPQLFEELADAMVYLYYSGVMIAEAIEIIEMLHERSEHIITAEEEAQVVKFLNAYDSGKQYHKNKDAK